MEEIVWGDNKPPDKKNKSDDQRKTEISCISLRELANKMHLRKMNEQKLKKLEVTLIKLQKNLSNIQSNMIIQINELKREYFQMMIKLLENPEYLIWDGWENVNIKRLDKLSIRQLEFLVWKRSGISDMFRWETIDITGEEILRSLDERYNANLEYLKSNYCNFCNCVLHGGENCFQFKKKKYKNNKNYSNKQK